MIVRCSALPRIMRCPASAVKPDLDIDTSDETAALGTAAHRAMEMIVSGDACHPDDIDLYALASDHGVDEDELRMLAWNGFRIWQNTEFLFDIVSAEKKMEHHFHGHGLTGTADVIATIAAQKKIVVIDWKSGRKESDYLAQLKGYGLMAMRNSEGYERVTVGIGWMRSGVLDVHEFSVSDLEKFESELTEKLDHQSHLYAPSESACLYCPMQRDCDARRALVRAAGADIMAAVGEHSECAITHESLASLYPKSRMLKKALADYEVAIKSAVSDAGGSIIVGECEMALTERTRATVIYDPDALKEFLSGDDIASLRPTISKTDLEKAVAAAAPRGQKGTAKEACMRLLRERGKIEETKYSVLEYRKI